MAFKRVTRLGALAALIAAGLTTAVASCTTQTAPHAAPVKQPRAGPAVSAGADRGAALPLPGNANSESHLSAVACPAPLTCVATGWYTDNSGKTQGLLVTADGALWNSYTAPLPRNASPVPNAQFLDGGSLACPGPAECVAVGLYDTRSPNPRGMLLTGFGARWTATAAPLPGNADPAQGSRLSAVACPAPSSCVAVGSYTDAAAISHGLLVTGSRTAWSAVRAPLPAGVPSGRFASISSVACASATSCVAVGTYADKTGNYQGFLLTGAGKSWTAVQTPLPGDAAPAGPYGRTVSLGPVACPALSQCIVLGSYTGQSGSSHGMLITGMGTRWAARNAPVPPGADAPYGATLSAIACPSAATCLIVGAYIDSYEYPHGMTVTGSAAAWRAAAAPLPASGDAVDPSNLTTVTCSSPGACIATGAYTDRRGYAQTMLLTGSAASWAPAEVLMPAGATEEKSAQVPDASITGGLEAAACFSAGECLAVGSYYAPYYSGATANDNALLVQPPPGPHRWPDIYLATAFTVGLYTYPGFPASIGIDNHDYISGISWKSVSADTAEATGMLSADNCTPDCASGTFASYPVELIASSPRQCLAETQLAPPLAVHEYVFSKIDIAGQVPAIPASLTGPKLLSPDCVALPMARAAEPDRGGGRGLPVTAGRRLACASAFCCS